MNFVTGTKPCQGTGVSRKCIKTTLLYLIRVIFKPIFRPLYKCRENRTRTASGPIYPTVFGV